MNYHEPCFVSQTHFNDGKTAMDAVGKSAMDALVAEHAAPEATAVITEAPITDSVDMVMSDEEEEKSAKRKRLKHRSNVMLSLDKWCIDIVTE